jgi:acyl-CoA hydrolase
MRIEVVAVGEDLLTGERRTCTRAEVVMVAMGADGRPTPVRPLRS